MKHKILLVMVIILLLGGLGLFWGGCDVKNPAYDTDLFPPTSSLSTQELTDYAEIMKKIARLDKKEIQVGQAYGTSMLPLMPAGCVYLFESCRIDHIQIGDLVLFRAMGKQYCHRAIEIHENGIVTMGTNLDSPDPVLITPTRLIGRVVGIFFPAPPDHRLQSLSGSGPRPNRRTTVITGGGCMVN